MSWFDELIDDALKDPYLNELIIKAEKSYTAHFLDLHNIDSVELSEKEFSDLLRFVDILCRSKDPSGRNKAYKIISLLYDNYSCDPFFQSCSDSVLTKLGIFPTLQLLGNNTEAHSNMEVSLEKSVKETFQMSPLDGKVFTDSQYVLFEKMKNSNHFSFSGPTSFGKSFIMEAFINYIIAERNGSDNIVILVPTRALINQVSSKLKQEIKNPRYKILTHPVIPDIFHRDDYRYIFVFTPERWISYISNPDNPSITYMFVDEAQKVIAQKDSRSPLYYHAILLAERKSVNLYFASPNIPNAEVFLELFEKSQDEVMVISDSPVAQNRYFFDFVDHRTILFSDTGVDIEVPYNTNSGNGFLSSFLKHVGRNAQNIVYCNTIEDTINFALKFSKSLPSQNSKKIEDFISLIKTFIHKDYFLIECVRHGVAFHFGRLPQRIREQVEYLFSEGELNYVFCTSTLLEGVNLPAKNIFILNNAIGLSKFSDIDFWNLAGRAGRLSKELSGNIICVRANSKKNRWDQPSKDLKVVRDRKIQKITPSVIKGEHNFYENLGNAIQGTPFTSKNHSQTQIDIWNHYSNILCIHQIGKNDSVLISNFLKRNPAAKQILSSISKANLVPLTILEQSSTIKPKYQNELWNTEQLQALPSEVSKESCLWILELLYSVYHWDSEESGGRNPMVRDRSRLQYFSILMYSWVQGTPLNMIINSLIRYYKTRGQIFYQGHYESFDYSNKAHINHIINDLMADIDTALRFKIKNYILNYSLICAHRLGDSISENWVDYIEYGTTNPVIIALQTIGFPRHLASFIIDEYPQCVIMEGNTLVSFDDKKLRDVIDKKQFEAEFNELAATLNWQ